MTVARRLRGQTVEKLSSLSNRPQAVKTGPATSPSAPRGGVLTSHLSTQMTVGPSPVTAHLKYSDDAAGLHRNNEASAKPGKTDRPKVRKLWAGVSAYFWPYPVKLFESVLGVLQHVPNPG